MWGQRSVVVLVLLVTAGCSPGSHPSATSKAEDACQTFVSNRLKAPSTADFTGVAALPGNAANAWTVIGNVDAQNGFGAQIRTRFTCQMHTAGGRYVLESVQTVP